jgi:hypothetical protein
MSEVAKAIQEQNAKHTTRLGQIESQLAELRKLYTQLMEILAIREMGQDQKDAIQKLIMDA